MADLGKAMKNWQIVLSILVAASLSCLAVVGILWSSRFADETLTRADHTQSQRAITHD